MRRRKTAGFTIVEVMIFLVVSAGLLGAAVTAFSAQNRRTQFTQSVQTFEQNVRDVLNDVDTGYFSSDNKFRCTIDGGWPNIVPAPEGPGQGANEDCIYIGKAVVTQDRSKIDIYTIFGRRQSTDDFGIQAGNTRSISDARPNILQTSYDDQGNKTTINLGAGVEVNKILYDNDTNASYQGFAVLSGFGGSSSGGVQSGIFRSSLAILSGHSLMSAITGLSQSNIDSAKNGIRICLQQGSGGRQASIFVGPDSQRLTTWLEIDNVPEECNE